MPRKHMMTAVRCDIVTINRVGTMAFLLWSMKASIRDQAQQCYAIADEFR